MGHWLHLKDHFKALALFNIDKHSSINSTEKKLPKVSQYLQTIFKSIWLVSSGTRADKPNHSQYSLVAKALGKEMESSQ